MIRTYSAAETRERGEALAALLRAGDVILLEGELGAGNSDQSQLYDPERL